MINDSREFAFDLGIFDQHRFPGAIGACHHEREVKLSEQEIMQAGIRQHDPNGVQARGDRARKRAQALAEDDDRAARATEKLPFCGHHVRDFLSELRIRHQRERLPGSTETGTQLTHCPGVSCVAGDVGSTDSLDRHDRTRFQSCRGAGDRIDG